MVADEKYETSDDIESECQTLRMYDENKEATVGMLKMNIKLPIPTQYDGKTPQFNEWEGEVKAYLTVHNIYIEDLLEESTKSLVPLMVIATMQTDAAAEDLRRFNQRYPQAVNHGEDHSDDYMDRWEAMDKKKADIAHFSQTLNYVLLDCRPRHLTRFTSGYRISSIARMRKLKTRKGQ
eukprot:5042764-Amphidinium_carterae.1